MPRYFIEEPPKDSDEADSDINSKLPIVLRALGNPIYTPPEGGVHKYEYPEAQIRLYPGKLVPLIAQGDYKRKEDSGHISAERLEKELIRDGFQYYSDSRVKEAVKEQRDRPQMFHHRPTEVSGLDADPSMRHTVPTLLGLAINQFGPVLKSSANLSKHSSRIVQRGMEAGVVIPAPGNPRAEQVNYMEFIPKTARIHAEQPNTGVPIPHYMHHNVELPDSEVDAARRTIKSIIRPKTRSAQFDALEKWESDRDKPYNPETDSNSMRIPGIMRIPGM